MRTTLGHMSEGQRLSESVTFNAERHEYKRYGVVVPSVTQVLANAGRCPWEYVDEDIRLHSVQRGTSVHWMCQLEDEGALNYRALPKGLRGYRKAWVSWKRASGFIPLWIEHRFLSRYGFAGTLDRAGSFPSTAAFRSGTSGVVDIKTGEIPDYTRYQLAAYSLAVDNRFAIARNIRRVAVRLRQDGTYGKTKGSLTTVDVAGELAQRLRSWVEGKEADAFLFPNTIGGFILKDNYLHRVLYPLKSRLGIPRLNFEILRRTFSTLAGDRASVKDVQRQMRHAKPEITAEIYMQAIPESVSKMVADMYAQLLKPITESVQ